MTRRTYHQYCPIAYGLDLIGERWTLLIVRELGLGPRRFGDLLRGLPGIGTNLLSERLKTLEETGVITPVTLPSPARVQAYALAERGRKLLAAIAPLALWGLRILPDEIPEGDFIGAVPTLMALRLLYHPRLAQGEHLGAEVHLDPDTFRLALSPEGLAIEQGVDPAAPLAFATTPRTLSRLIASGHAGKNDEVPAGIELRRGSPTLLYRFFEQFARPAAVLQD